MSITLNSYVGSSTNVIVPTTKDNIRITTIGSSCFASKSITSIIGDSILNIKTYAFSYCSSLTSVSFPNCSYIGDYAFGYCSSLVTVSFPNCSYIGNYAFGYCKSLTTALFPNCSYINGGAFNGTTWLSNQFSNSSIARLTTNYEQFLISAASAQISGDIVDTSTTFICGKAFQYCKSLTTISFPNCRYIGGYDTFAGCSSLTTVSFPNCSYIGQRVFEDCSSLTEVYFPNCSYIGGGAFVGTSISNWEGLQNSWFTQEQGCLLERSTNSLVAFAPKASFTTVKVSNCSYIGESAFCDCSSLVTVSFPKYSYIDDYAFERCSSLTTISFPKCSYIGMDAFFRCNLLSTVVFPNCSYIQHYAFQYCNILTTVSFPNCSYIGGQAFSYCSSLTTISFPNCNYIGQGAFENCGALVTASFSNCSYIGYQTFRGCTSLTTTYFLSTNIATLGASAFYSCTALQSIYVPNSLLESYKVATNWSYYASKIVPAISAINCKSLTITGDNCAGRKTSTTIHVSAICDFQDMVSGEITENLENNFDTQSESFPQNTSTTETVTRTLSYTYFDKTATCQITQGVWMSTSYTLENQGTYGFTIDSTIPNPDSTLYEGVYKSNNQGKSSSQAVTKITFSGYEKFTVYIRSAAESNYDYTIASTLDAPSYPTDYNSSTAKTHTRGNQQSGTALSNYTKVEYETDGTEHFIYIVFRKDAGGNTSLDSGYFLVQKD